PFAADPAAATGGEHGHGQGGDQQRAEGKLGGGHVVLLGNGAVVRARGDGRRQGYFSSDSICSQSADMASAAAPCCGDSGSSGRRRPWPKPWRASTALTGMGLDSTPRKS